MIMENGFSSPRAGSFPVGLRVLVVDDDPTWLKILEKMLKKCSYEVTTCCLARDALNLLRERKDGFDIVISDVNMPDMDGFKLLEHVGLEMDLPVIMMSVDGETSRVMKGVQHGACDYLLKPIRMKELKNIWQHVLRKRIHEVRDAEFIEGVEGIQMTRTGSDLSDEAYFLFGEDMTSPKKRKDTEFMYDDKEPSDVSSSKKARVVWSIDLHQEFVKAVDQIGYDKVGPKKILDLMNVPWLTRENVASHLQKYRLYLSRLQKDSEHNHPSGGVAKLSDKSPSDSIGSFGIQNNINLLHKDSTNGCFEYSSNGQLVQHMVRRSVDPDRTAITQIYGAEPRRALGIDVPDPRKPRSASVECSAAFPLPKLEAKCVAQYPWRDIPSSQPKQENKPSFRDGNLSQFPMDGQWQHLTADSVQPTLSAGCKIGSSGECGPNAGPVSSAWSLDNRRPLETTTSVPDRQSIVTVPNRQAIVSVPHHQDIVSVPNHQPVVTVPDHHQDIVSVPSLLDQLGMKNQGFDWDCIPEYGLVQKHVNLGVQAFTNLDESLPFCFIKGDCLSTNLAAQNLQFPEMSCHSGLISEGPMHLFDGFDNEGLYDPAECSLFDPGLFIV